MTDRMRAFGAILDQRLSRRRFLLTGAAASTAALSACLQTSEPGPASPATTPSIAGIATPSASVTTTAIPGALLLRCGGREVDPLSHDFNANVACGGEPLLWSGLLTIDDAGQLAPGWAERWETSEDATRWTFHLRPDNHGWSNGDQVTAGDFVWSWQRLLAPSTMAPQAPLLFDIVNAREINSGALDPATLGAIEVDNWTLEVVLTTPMADFGAIVASPATVPAYQPAVEAFGAAWTEAATCVSNGPFRLAEWEHGVRLRLAPNPGHWLRESINVEAIVRPITSAADQQERYAQGSLDVLPLSDAAAFTTATDASIREQRRTATVAATWLLVPNIGVPPFSDVAARQALSHLIDRERLVQLSRGQLTDAVSLAPRDLAPAVPTDGIAAIQRFDVDAALGILADRPTGDWPPITLAAPVGDDLGRLLRDDVVAQLAENLGVAVSVLETDVPGIAAALAAGTAQLALLRWDARYADPFDGYHSAFAPLGDALPDPVWNTEPYVTLLGQARAKMDTARRTAALRACEELLQSAVAYIPLAHPTAQYLFQPWVTGAPADLAGVDVAPLSLFDRLAPTLGIEGRPVSTTDT